MKQMTYRDPVIAELRPHMKVLHTLVKFPNIKFVPAEQFPKTEQAGAMYVPWLYENFIQLGRMFAHLQVGDWALNLDKSINGMMLENNYVHASRFVMRWTYEVKWHDKRTNLDRVNQHRGWNVFYPKDVNGSWEVLDPKDMQQHPMISMMHGTAANNRAYPARWGASKVMSWCATPKYALIGAALSGKPMVIEMVNHYDWRATITKGFQSELGVLSGEFEAKRDAQLSSLFVNEF